MTAVTIIHVGTTAVDLPGWGLLILIAVAALLGGSR